MRRALEGRDAAYWAFWADTLPILRRRHPSVVAKALRRVQSASLEGPDEATLNLAELAKAATRLQEAGFALPTWDALADGGRPPPALVERALGEPLRGWQRAAAACLDASACTSLLSDLDTASRACMLSPAGPGGSRALTALSHSSGVPTLELVFPRCVTQTPAAARANRDTAVPVWRCTRCLG